MIVSYRLNLDKPGTHLVEGCEGPVTLYPVIVHDHEGHDHELSGLHMDEHSTIDIKHMILDRELYTDEPDEDYPPLMMIVQSEIAGSVFMMAGQIAHSRVIGGGIIDTTGAIINSRLEGCIIIKDDASIISSRISAGSTVVLGSQTIIESSEIDGTVVLGDAAAIYGSTVHTERTSSMRNHATIIRCNMTKPFRLVSNVAVHNGTIIYGVLSDELDEF